ncbi:hypothetical protein P4V86_03430 [Brevibacillus laterosporus]|uniref:hypothetical protein n=1 Tax=Brevibacillus laterosporus TaxID=1465 RepID=UPI000382D5F2|nr:hypothetical protein [Brevibacillus laterosporus]ATO48574.1 hypothetical protein BrL25_05260 [Brevibacillus laterosporus DSM 25]MED2002410.1 hypothetical protein [Brevibacillus laterosporus]
MGHTFGLFTKSQKGVLFANMHAKVAEDYDTGNPNHPKHLPQSPNAPRSEVDRYGAENNPILGDQGYGQIGRWQTVQLDALENTIDQIIEQYLRDKSWYASVRCREALWNMYRRIEWWVQQQMPPDKTQYQRVLQMIRDCIYKILENAEEPGGSHHGISLPTCPAPYYHHYSGNYFNHFDARIYEIPLFLMKKDVPFSHKFPDFFRYVSTTEDQEWVTVHSVGKNEQSGAEMILKLDLGLLEIGNSSKITFNWRVKRYGQVRFKYLASAKRGNGLLFYINGQQVGGEWSESTGWKEVAFTLQPGQMYKFDWLIRKMRPEVWQHNGIYIKDIEVVEIVDTSKPPVPLDYDVHGEETYAIEPWVVYSSESIVQAHFKGFVINDNIRSKTLTMELENNCDGEISFAYKTGIDDYPEDNIDYDIFFDDLFVSKTQTGYGEHGSIAESQHGYPWLLDGKQSETVEDDAQITYEIIVGKNCKVDLTGTLEMLCPPREIDHYEPYNFGIGVGEYSWSMSGNPTWVNHGDWLRLDEPEEGRSVASTSVNLPDDGWFIFSFEHELRPTERFEVRVNGDRVHYSKGDRSGTEIEIPLKAGYSTISFYIIDSQTETPFTYDFNRPFYYGKGSEGKTYTVESPMGSTVDITRDWSVTDGGAKTTNDGDEITYDITLNPHSSVTIKEHMRIFPSMDDGYDPITGASRDILEFEELFNEPNRYNPALSFEGNWKWVDMAVEAGHAGGDGVMLAQGHNQTHIANFSARMRNPGYITWQYGGKFDPGEALELQVDGVTVWTGNVNGGAVGTNCMYPLPPGRHDFRWVYKDGTKFTPGSNGGSGSESGAGNGGSSGSSGSDLWGERCYPKGDATSKLDYGQSDGEIYSDRTSAWRWGSGGNKTYYDGNGVAVGHGVEFDGGVITRDFYAPYFGEINYLEKLKVYPIKYAKVDGLRSIDTTKMMADDGEYKTPVYRGKYYGLPVTDLSPLNNKKPNDETVAPKELDSKYTRKIFDKFYTTGKFKLDFDFYSYLKNSEYQGARLRVWLVKDSDWSNPIILDNIRHNYGGNYKKDYRYLGDTDWTTAKHFSVTKNLSPGWYWICIGVTDTKPDRDQDPHTKLNWYTAIKNLTLKVSDPNSVNGGQLVDRPLVDYETYVWVRLTDLTTGMVVYSDKYYGNAGEVAEYMIDLNGYVEPGHAYSVSYTLSKGTGVAEGTSGLDAGAFTLSKGGFQEYWDAYCSDANGNVYRVGDSPHPDTGWWKDPFPDTDLDDGGSYAWLDVIRLYENRLDPCRNTRIAIEVYEEGDRIDRWYVTSFDDELVEIPIKNDSDQKRDYKVVVRLDQGCPGDGAMIWGGEMDMHDEEPVPPSWAEVTHFEVWDNKPIWMGGCDGSSMRVQVLREDGQSVYDQTYYGDGYSSFGVSQLLPTPYTKYKVIITTDQKGTISTWTGKEYFTTFRLHEFKAYEWFRFIPKPYNSKLEFFIDGDLIQTFTTEGGYYTFKYPVMKGKHVFQWKFTTHIETGERSWEFAQLDWVELTNWICEDVHVTPYCEGGGGDKCIEALIKCLLEIWKNRPKMCVIGKRIWLFT